MGHHKTPKSGFQQSRICEILLWGHQTGGRIRSAGVSLYDSGTPFSCLRKATSSGLKKHLGVGLSARELRAKAGIETLEKRREASTLKFAEKTLKNPRFSSRWFPPRAGVWASRSGDLYLEKTSRTDRHSNSPINYMIRQLNARPKM